MSSISYHVQKVDIRPWNKWGIHNTSKKLSSSGLVVQERDGHTEESPAKGH